MRRQPRHRRRLEQLAVILQHPRQPAPRVSASDSVTSNFDPSDPSSSSYPDSPASANPRPAARTGGCSTSIAWNSGEWPRLRSGCSASTTRSNGTA